MVGEGGGDPKFQLGEVFLGGGSPKSPPLSSPQLGQTLPILGVLPFPLPRKMML